jgi:hypothetical protein
MKMPDAMPTQPFDVSADLAQLEGGEEAILLKLSSPQIELNVWLLPAEVEKLKALRAQTPGLKSLRLGLSVGQSVYWSRDIQGKYYLLVGQGDETWDLGVTLDPVEFESILQALSLPAR